MLVRIAGQQAGRRRTWQAAQAAWSGVAGRLTRILHQLFLEVTGFVFLVMAGIGGIALSREYAKYQTGQTGPGRVVIAVLFCLTFGYFGLSSFWRVRRKKQG